MPTALIYTIIALITGSLGSIGLAALLLLLNGKKLEVIATYLSYLAGGTLLGAAFLGMIPKATSLLNNQIVYNYILFGIIFFFVLEKIIVWRTCRDKDCERHLHAAAPMILVGDAFHNAIDGIVIAVSFLSSIELGIFVSISIVFHEIPQELGDFGILIRSGYSKRKALLSNLLSGSSAIFAGLAAWFFMGTMKSLIPYVLAFSASSFLYIALADLIPEMHQKTKLKESIIQILFISLGILIIFIIKNVEH